MRVSIVAALLALISGQAFAQGAVSQSGIVVSGNLASWTRNGVLQDSGISSISINLPTLAKSHLLGNANITSQPAADTSLTALIDSLGTPAQGDILYRDTSGNGWQLLAPGSAGQVLTTGGAAANPSWSSISIPTYTANGGIQLVGSNFSLIAPVTVALGGTGITTGTSGGIPYFSGTSSIASSALLTSHAVLIGGGSGATPYSLSSNGTSGQLLKSNGASADPSWTNAPTGTVTSVATSGGLTGGTITATGTVSCIDAASGVKGCPTPDTNAAHFLAGDGTWATPAGTTPAPKSATSAAFAPGSMGTGTCQTQVTAVTGATTSMAVAVSPSADPGTGFTWAGFVSSAGNVTLTLCNITTGSLTPASTTYNIRAIP